MFRYVFQVKRGPVTILDQEGIELGNTAERCKRGSARKKIVTEEALN
jgi:hypothetical protein